MRLVAVAAIALIAPSTAAAALEVKLSVFPRSPKAGARTVVEVRPYWTYNRPDGTCCRLVPADVNYPFKNEVVSPTGRVFRVAVRKTSNPLVWSRSYRFTSPGRWTLRAPQWGPRYGANFGAGPGSA